MLGRATSRDIARAAGVSQSTVSRILNGRAPALVTAQTRERVVRLAEELNYAPNAAAQQLRRRTARALGLILPPAAHNATALFSFTQMFTGIAEETEAAGYALVLCPSTTTERAVERQRVGQVDGTLVMLPMVNDPRVRELVRLGAPLVLMNQAPAGEGLNWVDFDNMGSSRDAVLYLLGRGHRRIGFICWASLLTAQLRLQGYREALALAGIAEDPSLIQVVPEPMWHPQSATTLRHLLRLPQPPTAVLCASDYLAVALLRAAQAGGFRVPEDLAIVGYDDDPICAYLKPALTTIRPPFRDKGRAAARMLIEVLEDSGPKERSVLLQSELVIRESA
ncbi:MAG: LacI family DNA-binding transcriptional regulator [Chloroflexota bacterium]